MNGGVPACRFGMLRLTGSDSAMTTRRVNIRKDFMFIISKIFYGKCKIMIAINIGI